jgi:putative ABC transport system ATP-binding protein
MNVLGESDMVDDAVIRLESVRKKFTTEEVDTYALDDINLSIRRGEFLAVTGPSGCGKSTLLSILGLLDVPCAGTYWLNGQAVNPLGPGERSRVRNRDIGFVFQSFNLIEDLSALENVELPLVYQGWQPSKRRERALEVLDQVGMSHRKNHLPIQLSGGQQQRVAVARAIAGRPAVLLADEPTGNLDSANSRGVMDLLCQLHGEGSTLCMVTHDPQFAERADRVIHLFDGKILNEPAVSAVSS